MAIEDKRPRAPAGRAGRLSTRKNEHIQACLDDGVDRGVDSFTRHKLRYCALPEMALDEVSTEDTFAGRSIAAPLIISCMTGGPTKEMQRINRNLAKGAQALGIPVGLGSMRVMLADRRAEASFAVRELAPDVPLIANLGLVSFNHGLTVDDALDLVERLRPDVFGLHLNALQEVVQEDGDTDFRGLLPHLRTLCRTLPVPVLVKECGGGIAPNLADKLFRAGADYVDISGNDGTSWAAVEGAVGPHTELGALFKDFGIPTAWILERLTQRQVSGRRIVAGGGIRNGVQAVQALALGAGYVTLARPFLLAALDSARTVERLGRRLIDEMRTAMFLVGARSVKDIGRDALLEPVPFQGRNKP